MTAAHTYTEMDDMEHRAEHRAQRNDMKDDVSPYEERERAENRVEGKREENNERAAHRTDKPAACSLVRYSRQERGTSTDRLRSISRVRQKRWLGSRGRRRRDSRRISAGGYQQEDRQTTTGTTTTDRQYDRQYLGRSASRLLGD